MTEYEIIPLKIGEFLHMEQSALTYLHGFGEKVIGPIIVYLVRGGDKLVLVDTGASGEEWAKQYHHPIRQTEEMKLPNALRKLGIELDQIEIVVNTHLHWDHCFNNILFPKARIYVQTKEIQYAICPLPAHWVYYESFQLGMHPQWLKSQERMVAVDGDLGLLPGIDLVTIPGHTPGMQGVLVNTKAGKYLIASDFLGTFRNWDGIGPQKHVPSGIHHSLPEYYETFAKVEKICDYILPGHDLRVFEHEKYPY